MMINKDNKNESFAVDPKKVIIVKPRMVRESPSISIVVIPAIIVLIVILTAIW